jgi:acetyltransferase-like isoleucine patch superfamily enzyme
MKLIVYTFKALRKFSDILLGGIYTPIAKIFFMLNGVSYGEGLCVRGLMKIFVTRRGEVRIGRRLRVNSGDSYNVIGRQQKCIFWVEGALTIKDNVGISASAIICRHQITIGNNVVIGGNTVIYDTDFHSLDAEQRRDPGKDRVNTRWAPVKIGDNVFIGAHSTILKGVTIGDNSVVGACSVVAKNIPDNEIWAGNPAVCIRKAISRDAAFKLQDGGI